MSIKNRGFASMTPERRREIASRGGKSVSPANRAFARNPELATEAGRKGGQNLAPEARAYSKDRGLASAAGKKGGAISGAKRHEAAVAAARGGG